MTKFQLPRNAPAAAEAPGGSAHPTAGIDADIVAELSARVGRVEDELSETRRIQQKLWQAIRPIPGIVVPQITTTNGVSDYPELCSPRIGFWWDVLGITVNTFSAGSVAVYLTGGGSGGGGGGALADSYQRFSFTTKGALTFVKGQFLVPPGNRVVFSASGISGNASPTLYVTEIAAWALPAYLMAS